MMEFIVKPECLKKVKKFLKLLKQNGIRCELKSGSKSTLIVGEENIPLFEKLARQQQVYFE